MPAHTTPTEYCSSCGNTAPEDVSPHFTEDGYSNCCNEPVHFGISGTHATPQHDAFCGINGGPCDCAVKP